MVPGQARPGWCECMLNRIFYSILFKASSQPFSLAPAVCRASSRLRSLQSARGRDSHLNPAACSNLLNRNLLTIYQQENTVDGIAKKIQIALAIQQHSKAAARVWSKVEKSFRYPSTSIYPARWMQQQNGKVVEGGWKRTRGGVLGCNKYTSHFMCFN